jgi:type II secretory pathway pseudopilin PulG
MKQYQLKAPARQAGLTLLELTVVMTILVALAGLMVPQVRGFFSAAQNSTSVSSLAEVDKWIQSYNTKFMKEPNNMEALINSTGSTAPNLVYSKLMHPGYFNPIQLTSEQLTSLQMAGITSLYYNNPDTTDATFASTIGGPLNLDTIVSGTTSNLVAQVIIPTSWPLVATGTIEDYLADVFGTTANNFDGQSSTVSGRSGSQKCYDYVAFGIGNQSSLTGTMMSTAPVHFNSDGSSGPAIKYNRFVAIYQVDAFNNQSPLTGVATGLNPTTVLTKGCPAGIESAKFIGSVIVGNVAEGRLVGLARTQGQTHRNISSGG